MTDSTLLEIERLTRYPDQITGFTASGVKGKDIVVIEKPVTHIEPKTKLSAEFLQKPIPRREFLAYSTSGILGLFLLVASYSWVQSEKASSQLESLYNELEDTQFDQYVSDLVQTITHGSLKF